MHQAAISSRGVKCQDEVYCDVLRSQPEFRRGEWIRMGDRTPEENQPIYFVVKDPDWIVSDGVWKNGNPWRLCDGKPARQFSYYAAALWQPRFVPELPRDKDFVRIAVADAVNQVATNQRMMSAGVDSILKICGVD